MTYELVYRVGLGNAQSPFRVVTQPEGREVAWVNRFLDQCMVRGLAWHTLRGYAFSWTNFIRWWVECHATEEVTEQALGDSSLLDYLRYLSDQEPRPAANTINKCVWVAERALRCLFPTAAPQPLRRRAPRDRVGRRGEEASITQQLPTEPRATRRKALSISLNHSS
jgi:hypothetical protein